MAASQNKTARAAAIALMMSGGIDPAIATEVSTQKAQDVHFDADSVEFDYRNNTALLREVVVKQGDLQVKAREAQADGGVDNFANNHWKFRDQVRITTADGSLSSDRAEVTFSDNRVTRAVVVGSPATFEQRLEGGKDMARGRAGTIEYDVVAETVRLREDPHLTVGSREISAPNVVYHIRDGRILASGDKKGEERVHGRIKVDAQDAEKLQ